MDATAVKRKRRASGGGAMPPGALFPSLTRQSASASVGRGRRRRATNRVLGQCAELGAQPAAVALAVAWQHAAVSLPTKPGGVRIPRLEELGGPAALDREAVAMSSRWAFLREHLPTIHRLIHELPRWDRLLAAIPADTVADTSPALTNGGGWWCDPAGDVLVMLRNNAAGPIGDYYTPPSVAARLVDQITPKGGASILDPFCGTGRLLASAASWLWAHGRNPWSCGWFGVDDDAEALAVACLNLIGVGAGPHVWLHHGYFPNTEFVHPDGRPLGQFVDILMADLATRPLPPDALAPRPKRTVVVDPAQRWQAWQHTGAPLAAASRSFQRYLAGRSF